MTPRCQRHTPYPRGRATDEASTTQGIDGDGEGKGAAQTHEGWEDTDACRRGRERERERNGP